MAVASQRVVSLYYMQHTCIGKSLNSDWNHYKPVLIVRWSYLRDLNIEHAILLSSGFNFEVVLILR